MVDGVPLHCSNFRFLLLMSNQLETKKRNTTKNITETKMIYLLTKSRSHELSSTLHTRHRKTSLIALIMKKE